MDHQAAIRTRRPDKAQSGSGANAPRRILVVDDDEAIREVNTGVLSDFGYYVDAAEDGAAAWDTLQRKRYDLLITDNQMPKVSGLELLQKLRAYRIPMPVILATGRLPDVEFISRPRMQPSAVLLKPYTADELLKTVQTVLSVPGIGRERVELKL